MQPGPAMILMAETSRLESVTYARVHALMILLLIISLAAQLMNPNVVHIIYGWIQGQYKVLKQTSLIITISRECHIPPEGGG